MVWPRPLTNVGALLYMTRTKSRKRLEKRENQYRLKMLATTNIIIKMVALIPKMRRGS